MLLQIRHNSSHLNTVFFKLELIATILALLHDVLFLGCVAEQWKIVCG